MTLKSSDPQQRFRVIVLIGPPGSGKGTQGRILGAVPNLRFMSMGEILRSLDFDSQIGSEIQPYLERGDLVPAEHVVSAWLAHLDNQQIDLASETLVLDGLPRNVQQAESMRKHIDVCRVIHLACDDDDLLSRRIRFREDDRQDDMDEDIVRHRFAVYREQTEPLLDWFALESIATVDASKHVLEVLKHSVDALLSAPCLRRVEVA